MYALLLLFHTTATKTTPVTSPIDYSRHLSLIGWTLLFTPNPPLSVSIWLSSWLANMVGAVGVRRRSSAVLNMEASCGALLSELELIWKDIGETEAEKDRMMLEIEKECKRVYKTKIDQANDARSHFRHTIAAKEADLAVLKASLGDHTTLLPYTSEEDIPLKAKLAVLTPHLEELQLEKQERARLLSEITSQIEKINLDISGQCDDLKEEEDLSMRKINEYQEKLRTLQKDKSDRVCKVLEYVDEVHCLCGVLGMHFRETLDEVHPSLNDSDTTQTSTNISNNILDGLSRTIEKLKNEKKSRAFKLRELVEQLNELWNLMGTQEQERHVFSKFTVASSSLNDDITDSGVLSLESLHQVGTEIKRLSELKAGRMKQLVFDKRMELVEICRWAHIEPDNSTTPEKINGLIDAGLVDPCQLLDNIENQIEKAREEFTSRKDIMEGVGKWIAACEEEKWLEDYTQDDNRYRAGRGAHLNLKRAEKARITITKIPGIMNSLMSRIHSWEEKRNKPFMYDGERLLSILEDYKLSRPQKEEENKRYRDQKRLQGRVDRSSIPTPKRSNSLGRRPSTSSNGSMSTTTPRRNSSGTTSSTTDHQFLTPRSRSYSGRSRRSTIATPLNFASLSKGNIETMSSAAFATSISVCSGSEPGSPPPLQ